MKFNKVILAVATAAVAIVGSFAFRANANKRFNPGTLFSKTSAPCHQINCQRATGTNTCGSSTPYYTAGNCTGTQYSVAVSTGL